MSLDGNLLNTPIDVVTDSLILTFTLCAHAVQIDQLYTSTETSGLTACYVLFNVLLSNAQLAYGLMLAAYGWPNERNPVFERLDDETLVGMRALGAILGHLQIFVQWACWTLALTVQISTMRLDSIAWVAISAIACLHVGTSVVPAARLSLPKASAKGWDVYTIGLITKYGTAVAPALVALQFGVQLWTMSSRAAEPGGFNLLSTVLQGTVSSLLGWRWVLRLGRWPWDRDDYVELWQLYEWGFIAANFLLHAAACLVLLLLYPVLGGRS